MGGTIRAAVLERKHEHNPQCPVYFYLDFPEPGKTCSDLLTWTTGTASLTVLCNRCFHTSVYSQSDIHTVVIDTSDLGPPPAIKTWRIEVQCAEESCGFRLEVLFQLPDGQLLSLRQIESEMRLLCPRCEKETAILPLQRKDVLVIDEFHPHP